MPDSPTIQLDLRQGGSSDPGWHDVAASNGEMYGFCYTGGDDGAGGLVQTVGHGRDVAPVRLTAPQRYRIASCSFSGDTKNQLAWNGTSPRAGTIIDENTAVLTASYTINVTDTGNGNCTVPCDPPITNKPN